MKEAPLLTAELYKIVRKKRPAALMTQAAAVAIGILFGWSAMTPINDSVAYVAKIVPQNGQAAAELESTTPSSVMSGTVSEVLVVENQLVEKGDLLIQLDSSEYAIESKIKQNQVAGFRQEIAAKSKLKSLLAEKSLAEEAELKAQLRNEKQEFLRLQDVRKIDMAKAADELKRLEREYGRYSKLRKQGAVSQSEFDVLKTELKNARDNVAGVSLPVPASTELEIQSRLDACLVSRKESAHTISNEIKALEAKLATTLHEIDLLHLKIQRCQIRAGVSGTVSRNNVKEGDFVVPGLLDISLAQKGLMAEAFMPSRLMSNVKAGDEASIMFDGINWLTKGSLPATVMKVSPDLVREEVAQGDGSSVLTDGYRVWFELDLDSHGSKWDCVRLGMTGVVEVRTGKQPLAMYLMEQALGKDWLRPKSY